MTTFQFSNHIQKIESLLFGFAMRLTKNRENAKDLMQETLMRCFDKKDRFQMGTNFKSWVTTVMYNSFVNHYRRAKTKNKVVKPIEDFNYLVENKPTRNNAYSRIMMKELKGMVNDLSDNSKVPFQMHVQGYQYDEIAAKLDLTMGTVKSRIFYARKKLQKMVASKYDTSDLMAA